MQRIGEVHTLPRAIKRLGEKGAAAHARRLDDFARLISSNLPEAELRAAFAPSVATRAKIVGLAP